MPERITILAFAVLMCAVAMRMLAKARQLPGETQVVRARVASGATLDTGTLCRYSRDGRLRLNAPCSAALLLAGVVVGALSGFFRGRRWLSHRASTHVDHRITCTDGFRDERQRVAADNIQPSIPGNVEE